MQETKQLEILRMFYPFEIQLGEGNFELAAALRAQQTSTKSEWQDHSSDTSSLSLRGTLEHIYSCDTSKRTADMEDKVSLPAKCLQLDPSPPVP
jgi:hypothetical protein